MAKTGNSTSRKTNKGGSEPFLTKERKLEIIGVVIMSISLLLGFSILTYSSADVGLVRGNSISDLMFDQSVNQRITNWLGPLGALLSYFMVYSFCGYMTIIFPGVTLFYGWYIFRHHDLTELHRRAAFYLGGMVLFATITGWTNVHFELLSEAWSGTIGLRVAGGISMVTGFFGSAIILFTLAIIAILLIIDGDIQKTVDRFKDLMSRASDAISDWKEKRAAAAAEKAEYADEEDEEDEEELFEEDEPQPETKTNGRKKKLSPEEEQEKMAAILEASRKREEERISKEKSESEDLAGKPPRAIIERPNAEESSEDDDADEPDITVKRGEGEEEADAKELEKKQKEQQKPVIKYKFPGIDLLDSPPDEGNEIDMEEINQNKKIILEKLQRHGIDIVGIEAVVGPTVTLYELEPAPDVKISKIEGYANDLKMAMATHGLRIIAPIPGKSAVGIEVPNRKRETVFFKQVINTKKFVDTDMTLPVAFGKTIENDVFMVDLAKLPHVLMAGATGSGKSVGINTIISCLLYKCHPEDLKFVMVDPKKIELALYRNIQNHYLATLPDMDEPIITDTARVQEVLNSVCKEMDSRYDLLKMAMVREIKAYNAKFKAGDLEDDLGHRHLPYIVVIIDELADLMITAGKGIEEPIARLAQLARAVGIHLVVATQRPSVNVITGTIKANFPARIAYRVASRVDSRTILDTIGADQLVGRGDMLFTAGSGMIRVQNAFVSTEEVERINAFIGSQQGYTTPFYLPKIEEEGAGSTDILDKSERDDLFEEAAKVVVMHQQGSVSLLQ